MSSQINKDNASPRPKTSNAIPKGNDGHPN